MSRIRVSRSEVILSVIKSNSKINKLKIGTTCTNGINWKPFISEHLGHSISRAKLVTITEKYNSWTQ